MSHRLAPGSVIDGFVVGESLHEGGTGYIYEAIPPPERNPGFPIVLKTPGIGPDEPTIGIEGFEMEQMILPTLAGPHVPRFVATGAFTASPYIAMERIEGTGLARIVEEAPLPAARVARLGAALADALRSLHTQHVIHLDLKPENVIIRRDGTAVLLDFGFARHAHLPDLLAVEQKFGAGSAAYVSPEQLQQNRSDPRSDLFALGAILYQLATGFEPFGNPRTYSGMRDRLWKAPEPPRAINDGIPPWLQEVILRCLEVQAKNRYQSAAHVAFDLRHPEQVALTARAERTAAAGFFRQVGRWWRARRRPAELGPPAHPQPDHAPVILVAVDTEHPGDPRHGPLQWTTRQILSLNEEFRLMCVSVIGAATLGGGKTDEESASGKHLEHKMRLRQWVAPMKIPLSQMSLHVIESGNPAETLLELARANNVDLIVLGAPGPSQRALAWWRSVASSVTANAHCSVHVVRVPEGRGHGEHDILVPAADGSVIEGVGAP